MHIDSEIDLKIILEKELILKSSKLDNYWDYLSILFGELDSFRFANFNYEDAKHDDQKAIGWLILLMNEPKTLEQVFKIIFSIDFITNNLYDHKSSYICT